MPGVYRQPTLGSSMAGLAQRIRALETQQQMILSNLQGLSVMAFGLIPGSNPQRYGLEAVDPNTGGPLAFLGYDSGDDTAKMQFLNSAGQLTLQIDSTGFHYYDGNGDLIREDTATGTTYYDPSGVEQVQLGEVNASPAIYGLAVRPSDGSALQLVAGSVQATADTAQSVSSTSWTYFSDGPEVTVTVGASGMAQVTIGADVQAPSTNAAGGSVGQGSVGVSIDSGDPSNSSLFLNIDGQYAALGEGASGSITQVFSGLAAGSHTFRHGYTSYPDGDSTVFSQRIILVQAL